MTQSLNAQLAAHEQPMRIQYSASTLGWNLCIYRARWAGINIQWDDFVSNNTLHQRANIPLIADRLNELSNRFLHKLKDVHFLDKPEPYYKYDTYSISIEPHFESKRDVKNCLIGFGCDVQNT